jgi:hypothetical protein
MIYVGQNSYRLTVETGINLSGVSSSQIYLRYFSPTLSTGSYVATVSASTAGTIYYDMTSTDSLASGVWTFWVYVTHADSRVSIGEPFYVTVSEEGKA